MNPLSSLPRFGAIGAARGQSPNLERELEQASGQTAKTLVTSLTGTPVTLYATGGDVFSLGWAETDADEQQKLLQQYASDINQLPTAQQVAQNPKQYID